MKANEVIEYGVKTSEKSLDDTMDASCINVDTK